MKALELFRAMQKNELVPNVPATKTERVQLQTMNSAAVPAVPNVPSENDNVCFNSTELKDSIVYDNNPLDDYDPMIGIATWWDKND
jgi:hypothetical protein